MREMMKSVCERGKGQKMGGGGGETGEGRRKGKGSLMRRKW